MKTAFHIIPEEKIPVDTALLIEIGTSSVSMLFFNRDPFQVNGLLAYHIDQTENAISANEQVKKIVESEPLLQQNFSSVDICYNVPESTLVPRAFFNKEHLEETSDLVFGTNKTMAKYHDNIRGKEIVNVYQVDRHLVQTLKELYSFSSFYHSDTLLLSLPYKSNSLQCLVSYDTIKVTLEKNGNLLFTKQFVYHTSTDVVYQLLNVLTQYNEDPSLIVLTLSGMINDQSNLYDEIYKYFQNVRFDDLSENLVLPASFEDYPSHFFINLIKMATCV